jgi:hypothetical protein
MATSRSRSAALPYLVALVAMFSLPGAALACDCIRFIPGAPNWDRDITAVTEHATVILDAELIRPLGPLLEPAIVRPVRLLKGPRQKQYKVGVISDCALMLRAPEVKVGKRLRLILTGTPELYEATRCANLQSREFEAAVARACKSEKAH